MEQHDTAATRRDWTGDTAALHDTMAQLAATLDELATLDETVSLVVEAATELVPGCDSASITVRRESGRLESFASSSEMAARADQLQHRLAEGPCYHDRGAAAIVESPDVVADARWQEWGRSVNGEVGLASVLSIRLAATRDVRGALNLYSRDAGAFDRHAVELATTLGVHAGIAVRTAVLEQDLTVAIPSTRLIGQAQGLLMERFGMDTEAAFAVLRRLSQESNLKVVEIARRVVERRTRNGERGWPRSVVEDDAPQEG